MRTGKKPRSVGLKLQTAKKANTSTALIITGIGINFGPGLVINLGKKFPNVTDTLNVKNMMKSA